MIGLLSTAGDYMRRLLNLSLRQQEFQLSDLVSRRGAGVTVIQFDPHFASHQRVERWVVK